MSTSMCKCTRFRLCFLGCLLVSAHTLRKHQVLTHDALPAHAKGHMRWGLMCVCVCVQWEIICNDI